MLGQGKAAQFQGNPTSHDDSISSGMGNYDYISEHKSSPFQIIIRLPVIWKKSCTPDPFIRFV